MILLVTASSASPTKKRDQKVPKGVPDGKMTGRLSNRTCDGKRAKFRFAAEVQN